MSEININKREYDTFKKLAKINNSDCSKDIYLRIISLFLKTK